MILERTRIETLILAMLLICMVLVPTASAEKLAEGINDTSVEKINYPVAEKEPIITLNTTLEQPYWFLLEANDEEQKILFDYIDNCYASDEEKKEMKKAMKDIWNRYPDKITEKDYETLEKIDIATAEYLNDKYGNDDIGIKWAGSKVHNDIISIACSKMGVTSDHANVAKGYADDPDTWNSGFWQSYNHYYDPVLQTGYAHTNCANLANVAKDYYNDGQLTSAYQHLGYSSHYMADLGNPMHTGKEYEQYQNQWVHTKYESYVSDNWNTGQKYNDTVKNTNTFYTITDPEQSAKNLASTTRSDLDTLYSDVYYYPNIFGSITEVKTITKRVLGSTAKYNMGLVKYVRG